MKEFKIADLGERYDNLPVKYNGPKFDAHVHLGDLNGIDNLIHFRELYNIKKSIGIVWGENVEGYKKKHPNKFVFAKYFRNRSIFMGKPDASIIRESIREIYSQGYPVVKFWFAPRWIDYVTSQGGNDDLRNLKLSDPAFEPMYEEMEDLGLVFLLHTSDPDNFYEKVYQPESLYGKKTDHLNDLGKVLEKFKNLKVQGAHFGAQPEVNRRVNLSKWFQRYPNYFIDSSSGRWMARELGKDPKSAREFFIKYSDRILFGTDLVQDREKPVAKYYLTRYLTFQALLESSVRNLPLPFPDPENNNETVINGLDLPLEVLKKIYWENAAKLYKFN